MFSGTSCGICRTPNTIVADGSCWRLTSGSTISSKITKWRQRCQTTPKTPEQTLPLCQTCLNLVTETDQLETRFEENLKVLWHFLDIELVDIKPEIVFETDAINALLSVEANLKTEERDPIDVSDVVKTSSRRKKKNEVEQLGVNESPSAKRKRQEEPWILEEVEESDEESFSGDDWDVEVNVRESRSMKKVVLPKGRETLLASDFPFPVEQLPKKKKARICGEPRRSKKEEEPKEIDPENPGIIGAEDWLRPQCRLCEANFPSFTDLISHFTSNHEESEPFVCHFCLITFDSVVEFRAHVLADEMYKSTSGWTKCRVCSLECHLPGVLSVHWKENHREGEEEKKPFSCEECSESFVDFRDFVDHRRKQNPKHTAEFGRIEFKCDDCSQFFPHELEYKNHCRVEHGRPLPFLCRNCGKTFTRFSQLEKHLISVEFDPNRVCDRCGLRCKYAPDLSRHVIVDHNVTDLRVCDECGESFGSKTKLDWHKQFNHRVAFCPVCNERFPNAKEQDLVFHLNSTHGGDCTFKCDRCEEAFVSEGSLKRHFSDAHVKQFRCDKCGKSFCSASTLDKHTEMQHGGAVCPLCGVVLKNKFHIKRHIRTVHEKKKEEKCQFCGEGFAYTHGLYRHQAQVHNYRVDRMQRPCAECGKIFKTNSQLTKHRLGIHGVAPEGIKVYPCTRCDRKFTDARQLKEHTYSHEGIKPHQCPKCDHRTVTFVNLKTHMKWKHKRIVSRKFIDGVIGDDMAYDIVDEGPWNREEEEKSSSSSNRRSGKSIRDVPVRSLDDSDSLLNPPSVGSSSGIVT